MPAIGPELRGAESGAQWRWRIFATRCREIPATLGDVLRGDTLALSLLRGRSRRPKHETTFGDHEATTGVVGVYVTNDESPHCRAFVYRGAEIRTRDL